MVGTMDPSISVWLEDYDTMLKLYGGEMLADIVDLPVRPPSFFMCCKKALCGTCLVEVTEGQENLSPPSEAELDTIDKLRIKNPRARLACQARVWGNITLRTYQHDQS